MGTYTQIIYQVVFSTKQREQVLEKENRTELYKYIWGVLKKHNYHVYRINGIEDHLHIVTHLHPSIALTDLIKSIKIASSSLLERKNYLKFSKVGKLVMELSPIL